MLNGLAHWWQALASLSATQSLRDSSTGPRVDATVPLLEAIDAGESGTREPGERAPVDI